MEQRIDALLNATADKSIKTMVVTIDMVIASNFTPQLS